MTFRLPNPLYGLYENRLAKSLTPDRLPRHIGVILDGNRRWAKSTGLSARSGHQRGAEKIEEFLGWCEELHIPLVTLWMLSTDNLGRDESEVSDLLLIIKDVVADLAKRRRWRINPVGALDLLPTAVAEELRAAESATRGLNGVHVNVAVGYGGRREITDAVRDLLLEYAQAGKSLEDVAQVLDVEHIAEHLYTKGQPDPDLVIRTSGEQRLSGFLMWQSVHSEFYFCEALWPDFRRVDFLRAVRSYASRERRRGK